jgi:CRP/FNR family transcriptional regulator, cyclic AMP receptor protein
MDAARLATIPLFAELTLDQRARVAGVCEELAIDAGATLLKEGDFGYAMFAITAGTAEVVLNGVVVRRLGPGDVFGEIAVLSGGRRTATVIATSPMRVVTVLNRDVWQLEKDAPDVGGALRAQVAAHLEVPAH